MLRVPGGPVPVNAPARTHARTGVRGTAQWAPIIAGFARTLVLVEVIASRAPSAGTPAGWQASPIEDRGETREAA